MCFIAFSRGREAQAIPALGRALFEPFDKAQDKLRELRSRRIRVRLAGNPKDHAGAEMVLGPFAETKGPRLPGRDPATKDLSSNRTTPRKTPFPNNVTLL